MKILKFALVVLTLMVLGFTLFGPARADQWNKKTIVTVNQPVEIPGKVLPAGKYTFKLLDSPSNRHIVQIWNEDGTQLITTILAIPNYRLEPTGETVMNFHEKPAGQPVALKAWFYPGDNFGQEFVYPREEAIRLAEIEKEPVPAMATEGADLKTVPLVAETPEKKELPIEEVFQTTPPIAQTTPAPIEKTKELPKTASSIPLISLLGLAAIALGLGLKLFRRQES
jgi:LPXTG-motif cell wall-anchored protein